MTVNLNTDTPAARRLVKEYDLSDVAPLNPEQKDHYEEYFTYLAQYCVFIGEDCLVRHKDTGCWSRMTIASAKRTLWQQHGGPLSPHHISQNGIDKFFKEAVVNLDGTILIPNCPTFCLYRGSKRLNVWRDTRHVGDGEDIEKAEDLLRLINENLCNQPEKSMAEMFDEIEDPDCQSEFRYVVHWLAANYQYPGLHLNTALWFCGPMQGVGKGTLVRIMKDILGAQYVGKATDGELTRQWSQFLHDKILIEYDEVNISAKSEIGRKMKEWIGNDELQLEIRRLGPQTVPNTMNWICTTNELHPIFIDRYDRRHTFIKTSNDIAAKDFADNFNVRYYAPDGEFRRHVLSGFAALLGIIDVDLPFVMRCLHTEIRAEIIRNSLSPVELWFEDFAWQIGDYRRTADLWMFFVHWKDERDRNCRIDSQHKFARDLNKYLVGRGYIEPRRDATSRGYVKLAGMHGSGPSTTLAASGDNADDSETLSHVLDDLTDLNQEIADEEDFLPVT